MASRCVSPRWRLWSTRPPNTKRVFGSIEVSKLSESPVRYTIDVGGVDVAFRELELAQSLHDIRGAEVEASASTPFKFEFEPELAGLEVSGSGDDVQDVDEDVLLEKSSK